MQDYDIETLAVRAGIARSQFNEHSEALYLTSSFVFENAAQAADRFCNNAPGNIYSRFTNPTVTAFQERLAALEGAQACVATASGMSAILATAMATLKAGDHVVCSSGVFGATVQLFSTVLSKFGIETTYADGTQPSVWKAAIRPNTRLLFLETPSNPLTEVFDIAALAQIAREKSALLAVDNCFCTPALQKGIETLRIRMEAQSQGALELARWLESHPRVERVHYPGLASHPQHALAMRQQRSGGAIVSFVVKGGREAAWRVIDSTRMISITANLGDTKTTITHPGTTTHGRISAEARARAGITEGLLRIAVGLESVRDLQNDLARGLG